MAEIVLTDEERGALKRAAEMMRDAAESQLGAYWWSEVYTCRAETIESLLARASKQETHNGKDDRAD